MGQQTETIVWQRRYDEADHQRRMQRFWRFYAAPAALIIVAVALLSDVGAAAGVLIVLGLFGGLLFLWVWLTGRNERTNPTVTLDEGHLCWATRRVAIDEVTRFSTYMTSTSMTVAGSATTGVRAAKASLGAARFLLVDGSDVEFVWPALEERQLDELRAALEEVLPSRWRSLETLRSDT